MLKTIIQLKLQIEIKDFRALIGLSLIFPSPHGQRDVTCLENVSQLKQKLTISICSVNILLKIQRKLRYSFSQKQPSRGVLRKKVF